MGFQSSAFTHSNSLAACLVVEDSAFDQEKFRRILSASFKDIPLLFAETLEQAREFVANTPLQLVLLDNSLPDGVGTDLAVEMSGDTKLSKIPVIMVSDFPTPFMYQKAQMAGVKHVVDKMDFGARFIHDVLHAPSKTKRGPVSH